MSISILKEAREGLLAGIGAVEGLFGRHQTATQAATGAADAHAAISAEFTLVKTQLGELLTKVDSAIAGIEADASKAPTYDDLRALVEKLAPKAA